jgi:hypothetical protein
MITVPRVSREVRISQCAGDCVLWPLTCYRCGNVERQVQHRPMNYLSFRIMGLQGFKATSEKSLLKVIDT